MLDLVIRSGLKVRFLPVRLLSVTGHIYDAFNVSVHICLGRNKTASKECKEDHSLKELRLKKKIFNPINISVSCEF